MSQLLPPRRIPTVQQDSLYCSPYFFSIPDNTDINESINKTLELPYSAFVEIIDSDIDILKKPEKYLPDNVPDFLFCLTTASCYVSNIADILANSINIRFKLNNNKIDQITTCLHEAIMNAMVHGNLDMQSDFCSLDGLCKYQTEIEQRLQQGLYKFRYVHINGWNKTDQILISVSDEGAGFDMPDLSACHDFPSGRGLMFIRELSDKVWLDSDRHTLYMAFNR